MNRKTLCNWGMFLSIVFGITALIVGIVNVSDLHDSLTALSTLTKSDEDVSFSVIFSQILFPTFISIALTVVFWLLKDNDYTFDNIEKRFAFLNKEINDIKTDISQIKDNGAEDLPKDETDAKLNEILQMLAKIQNPTSNDK